MSDPAHSGALVAYLVGVTGISVAAVAVLYGLFMADFPAFLSGFRDDPAGAVQSDPASPALALAAVLLVMALFTVIVVFGATHSTDRAEEKRSQDGQPPSEE